MKEGLHIIPDSEYHQMEGYSKSQLDNIDKSPMHFKYALENPQPTTPAMAFGSLFHIANLEPEKLNDLVAVCPKVDRRTKAGKAKYAEFEENAGDKLVVTEADKELCDSMTEAIAGHDKATELLTIDGLNERAIFSKDKATGLLKRGKIDRIIESEGLCVDLKTTQDSSPEAFTKSVLKYNYHCQGAYYVDMCQEQGLDIHRFLFVVVEKNPPYAVAVYEMDAHMMEVGRRKNNHRLSVLRDCIARNEYPAYGDEIVTLNSPMWLE